MRNSTVVWIDDDIMCGCFFSSENAQLSKWKKTTNKTNDTVLIWENKQMGDQKWTNCNTALKRNEERNCLQKLLTAVFIFSYQNWCFLNMHES